MHNSLFGEDFQKSVDEAVKLQASSSKLVVNQNSKFRPCKRLFPNVQVVPSYNQRGNVGVVNRVRQILRCQDLPEASPFVGEVQVEEDLDPALSN